MSILQICPVLTGVVSAVSVHCWGLHCLSKLTQSTRDAARFSWTFFVASKRWKTREPSAVTPPCWCKFMCSALHRPIDVWHNSTARAIRKLCCTLSHSPGLMSYDDQSAQLHVKSYTPIVKSVLADWSLHARACLSVSACAWSHILLMWARCAFEYQLN